MKQIKLAASILSADFSNLADQIHQVEAAGVDWIHIDVMDGHFVPNISMGPFIVETVRRLTQLPLDVHLMIEKPERHIKSFIDAGADYISIHIENNPNVHRTLQEITHHQTKCGIVLNPGTPAEAIKSVIPVIDYILIMSVNPGYSGQSFIPEVVAKVSAIKGWSEYKIKTPLIEIDGGITPVTLPQAYAAGVDVFVAATAIFKAPGGISAGINALRNAVS